MDKDSAELNLKVCGESTISDAFYQADHKEMAARVLEAQQTINQASGENPDALTMTSVTAECRAPQHGHLRSTVGA